MQSSAPGVSPQSAISAQPVIGGPLTGPESLGASQGVTNDQQQGTSQAKYVTPPGYVVPAPSFSYTVVAQPSSISGSSQQCQSTDGVKFLPPASPTTLQPPTPTQSTGPSFSYGVVSPAIAGSSSSQQFQSSSATATNLMDGGKFRAPSTAVSLQAPAPAQAYLPGHMTWDSGNVVPKSPSSMHAPVSQSKGNLFPASRTSSGNFPVPTASEDSQKNHPTVAASVAQESTTTTSSASPLVNLPLHASSPNTLPALNPYHSVRLPTTFFPGPPGLQGAPTPGNLGTSGPPTISHPASSSLASPHVRPPAVDSSMSTSAPRPMLSSVSSNPSNSTAVSTVQNVQQQVYLPFPVPPMVSPPQALWRHPPQVMGPQRAPFLPYPSAYPSLFSMPLRPVSFPPVPLSEQSQPPGVSSVGFPGETFSIPGGPGQQSSHMGSQSPPPGTDKEEKASDLLKKDDDIKNDTIDTWTAHKTETGVLYYYNAVTGESTYERPSTFKAELEQVIVQPLPVSWEKLGSTDWSLVMTNDGKKYYYNAKSKVSSWQVPPEVVEMIKKQEFDTTKPNLSPAPNTGGFEEKTSASVSLIAPAVSTGGRDAMALRAPSAVSSSALDLIKKKLQDAGMPAVSSPLPTSSVAAANNMNDATAVDTTVKDQQPISAKEKSKDANGDGNMSDMSSDSDDDSRPTKEKFITDFKEMLKEKGIAPFSKWDKELPKLIFDARFKAVPGYALRRSLFEHYVRNRAEEERKEKRAAQKTAIEGFKQLLAEASEDIDRTCNYETFKRKWGSDPRFVTLDRKEREQLLNEKVLPLKKAYEENIQATRAAAVSSFKSMLRDNSDISSNTRWSRVRDSLRSDPRYKSVKHEDRDLLFNEYISELKAAEQEAERAVKAKRDEEEKLKEREREMRKRKEREEQEMERVRVKARRKDAAVSYQALLTEKIKDSQASWTESKPKLEKDPLGRTKNPDLDEADMEKLFREHIKMLYERCARDFRALLAETISGEAATQAAADGKTAVTSWSVAKRLLKSDPRYERMPRKERESLWRRYADEISRKQKPPSDTKDEKTNPIEKNKVSTGSRSSLVPRSHGRR